MARVAGFVALLLAVFHGTTGTDLSWTQGRSVDITVGPENAAYCKIVDPQMQVAFEGFDKCRIALDEATMEHNGVWKLTVGLPNELVTEESTFNVEVRSVSKPDVSIEVITEKPEVTLRCSVPSNYAVRSCSFRNPAGRVMLAPGTTDGYVGQLQGSGCELRILDVAIPDLGIWRCDVETNPGVISYGFPRALCPFAMSVPEIAAMVVAEPTLEVQQPQGVLLEGESTVLSCSIQSEIRYCFFRARNGTIFNVSPGLSNGNMEYVGAGLDAGECGIRVRNLGASDNGQWSCHVGQPDLSEPQQRVDFQLNVIPPIDVEQSVGHGNVLVVRGQVFSNSPLEYCRYVRMDGLGISTGHLPERYTTQESLSSGLCILNVANPSILEHHPWHIAAKVIGRDTEVYGDTTHTITMPEVSTTESPTPAPTLAPTPAPPTTGHGGNSNAVFIWVLAAISFLLLVLVGFLLIPKNNRRQTLERFDSFKSNKQVIPTHINISNTQVEPKGHDN